MAQIKPATQRGGKRKGAGRKPNPFKVESVLHQFKLSKQASGELAFRAKLCGLTPRQFIEELMA